MVITASIVRAMSASVTSLSFYEFTQRNNPEHGYLHVGRHENLKARLRSIDWEI
jgi:hypothetical protein